MLPLDAQHSSLVWATSIDEAKHLCSIPQDELSMKINDAFVSFYIYQSFFQVLSCKSHVKNITLKDKFL